MKYEKLPTLKANVVADLALVSASLRAMTIAWDAVGRDSRLLMVKDLERALDRLGESLRELHEFLSSPTQSESMEDQNADDENLRDLRQESAGGR